LKFRSSQELSRPPAIHRAANIAAAEKIPGGGHTAFIIESPNCVPCPQKDGSASVGIRPVSAGFPAVKTETATSLQTPLFEEKQPASESASSQTTRPNAEMLATLSVHAVRRGTRIRLSRAFNRDKKATDGRGFRTQRFRA